MSEMQRILIIVLLAVLAAGVLYLLPRIPQDPAYHNFADQRGWLGIPHFGNVVGNIGFLIVGALGLRALFYRRTHQVRDENFLWSWMFSSIILVGLGSAYYHLAPSNDTLLWDRLFMTCGFASLMSIVVYDCLDYRRAFVVLQLMVGAGIYAVVSWHLKEARGLGDLRFYAFMQFFPMLAIPMMLWLFPAGRRGARTYLYILVWYVAAKVFEHFDHAVFAMTGELVSGHTLKHIVAALGLGHLVQYIAKRPPSVSS